MTKPLPRNREETDFQNRVGREENTAVSNSKQKCPFEQ